MALDLGEYKKPGQQKINTISQCFKKIKNRQSESCPISLKIPLWKCDFCKMVAFENFEDALAHEKFCALGLRKQVHELSRRLRETEIALQSAQDELLELKAQLRTWFWAPSESDSIEPSSDVFPMGQPSGDDETPQQQIRETLLDIDSETDDEYSPQKLSFGFILERKT